MAVSNIVPPSSRAKNGADYDPVALMPVQVRHLTLTDLRVALHKGVADFAAVPTFAVFIVAIYPVIGLLLLALAYQDNLVPLLFPIVAGFALLGPVAAIGLYEISRRLEQGLPVDGRSLLGLLRSPSVGPIFGVAALLLCLFLGWIVSAHTLYAGLFGDDAPRTLTALANQVWSTRAGTMLFIVGNLIGAAFAIVGFAISVIALPMLIDRRVGMVTAILTSVQVVRENLAVMTAWGLMVAVLLAVASVPFLLGLAVVLPILGHATWHLYRRAVVRAV